MDSSYSEKENSFIFEANYCHRGERSAGECQYVKVSIRLHQPPPRAFACIKANSCRYTLDGIKDI